MKRMACCSKALGWKKVRSKTDVIKEFAKRNVAVWSAHGHCEHQKGFEKDPSEWKIKARSCLEMQ